MSLFRLCSFNRTAKRSIASKRERIGRNMGFFSGGRLEPVARILDDGLPGNQPRARSKHVFETLATMRGRLARSRRRIREMSGPLARHGENAG
ncbi:hypothetical protein ACS0Y6_35960, partial [Burkholderia gladioli]|uniref:hypothetical protein n=1 Tax=Burkholderia gladioli TaxID=28095 RepID=UPI003F78D0FA